MTVTFSITQASRSSSKPARPLAVKKASRSAGRLPSSAGSSRCQPGAPSASAASSVFRARPVKNSVTLRLVAAAALAITRA